MFENNILKRPWDCKCNGCGFFSNKNLKASTEPDGLSAQSLSAGFLPFIQQQFWG